MTASGRPVGTACAAIVVALLVSGRLDGRQPPSDRIDFATQVRPLLSDRCFRCHGPDAAKRKAELRLDVRDGVFKDLGDGWAVVRPGDPDRSELVRRTSSFLDDEMMPPPDSHLALSDPEKELLKGWVAQGADYKAHWSFYPVAAPAVPVAPRQTDPSSSAIDAFVRATLAREGMAPGPRASPETLIRRLAMNLTGLPPTIAEIDGFVSDPSPAAYSRAAERYLSSPAYGERMALDWLDLARYADTYGYQNDVERDVSPYRDWVIRAFNENLPYDQFLTWQLAGDLLPHATREQRVATAFNRLHRQTNEGGSIEEEFRTEYVADRVNTFGTAMLGLTLECARCHDHKFDPITQREYFSLFAFFNNIDESGLYSHFTNATPTPTLLLWPAHQEPQHRGVVERIAAVGARLQSIARAARPAFETWRAAARLAPPPPIAHLQFDAVDGETTPDGVASEGGRLHDSPRLVRDGRTGEPGNGAFEFSGDNAVVHRGLREFARTDAFSLAIRLMSTKHQPRAIVLHQSRAWTDAGSRGFELTLEDGRPFFGLIHFWPGNAIAVRARQPLPLNDWSRLVVTYDGSSRAAGIRMYLNGVPLATDIVRDRLYKDIRYDPQAGDRSSPTHPLTLGARFRDSGFKGGLIDDLQVFDIALTAAEVSGTEPGDAADASMFEHFLARHHEPYVTAARELTALREEENRLVSRVPELMVMEEMSHPRPAHVLTRGGYDSPGEVVPRDTPASLPPFPPDAPRDRLGLARWLTSRENPLAARVVVNRVWRMHFGRGIVASQEDFGSQGRLPTHPELLDWLAARFMDAGWDVKALHRLIVSSETFQQSSHAPPAAIARDPDNQLLARGPTVRLLAEQIRDSALAASGLLTRTVGGPSVKPYQPAGLWEQAGTGKTYTQDDGDKLYRRSLYTFWKRTLPPPAMTTFDALSREVCAVRGTPTVTPLQSLVLLNDPQFVEAARVLAEALLTRHPADTAARNREAFRTLIGRPPDSVELSILTRAHREQHDLFAGNPAAALELLRVGESPADGALPSADLAAMTAVVSLVMNFDEFTVLR